MAIVAVGGLVAAGCHGPPTTTTITVRAHCRSYNYAEPGEPVTDLGEFDLRISVRSPEWAVSGATVVLDELEVSGAPPGIGGVGWYWQVHLSSSQGLSPLVLAGIEYDFLGGTNETEYPATSTVTGAPGTYATLRMSIIRFVDYYNDYDEVRPTVCEPLAGQPSRLAAIEVK